MTKRYTPDDSPFVRLTDARQAWDRGTARRSLRLTPRDREAVESVRARYQPPQPQAKVDWRIVALLVSTWLGAGAWLLWLGY